MTDARETCAVEDLVTWQGELADLIRAAHHRAPSTPVLLDCARASAALAKVLAKLGRPDELIAWAEAIHLHEGIDIEEEHEDLLTQFLFEISTPELFEPVTLEVCRRWLRSMQAGCDIRVLRT